MKYKLTNPLQVKGAQKHIDDLIEKQADIELKELKGRRTLDQNSLYWLWLGVIEKESGYEKERVHLLFRAKFLQKPEERITKIIYPELWEKIKTKVDNFVDFKGLEEVIYIISYSTTELETPDFTHYLESIKTFSAKNFQIELLTLQDKNFQQFYNENKTL